LTKRLGVQAHLSTAFHPETDGQTERANAVLEQYLRAYVNYLQDDWADWTALAEFTANNTKSESTNVSPFFANSGQHPRLGYEPESREPRLAYQQLQASEANAFVNSMKDIEDFLKQEMAWAQAVYAEKANQKRVPAPAYKVSDRVWLDIRNLKTRRQSKKLDWKHAGPFEITKVVSSHAYRLDLPASMPIYPVFHTNLLRPVATDPLPGQEQPPPPPIEVDGEDEYLVEKIEDARFNKRRKRYEYLTRWVGYDESTWEPASELWNTSAAAKFEQQYPEKAAPRPS